jgi:hypothetical protein
VDDFLRQLLAAFPVGFSVVANLGHEEIEYGAGLFLRSKQQNTYISVTMTSFTSLVKLQAQSRPEMQEQEKKIKTH